MKKTTMPGMPEVEVVEIKTSAPVNVLADPAPAKKPAAKRTRKTATAEQANEVCSAIRDCLREKYGARAARGITIQYGGSMNAKNASELLAQPDVDGGLIGGASLKSADFATIVEAANQ